MKEVKKKNQLFYWGNDLVITINICVILGLQGYPNSIGFKDGFKYTSPVGYYGANSLGIFDMAGNVLGMVL